VDSRFDVVYLARHGETEWNRERRRQGQLDSPLTERGRAQAAAVAEALNGRRIDAVFCSPLGRSAKTARVIATRLQVMLVDIADLAEVHHGAMGGLTTEEIDRQFPGALEQRARDKFHWRFPGGENYADADSRAASALASIADAGVRRPLLLSHEMIGRMLLKQLLGLDTRSALVESQPHYLVHVIGPATGARTTIVADADSAYR
jgi:broad specificity phosphatase PhoE